MWQGKLSFLIHHERDLFPLSLCKLAINQRVYLCVE